MSRFEVCRRHGSALQDFNGYGEPYRRPVCLDCRWESRKGPLLTRVLRRAAVKGRFLLHWGPVTAFIRRSLTDRLNRIAGTGLTLEEVAPLVGASTERVMTGLRKFEERRGSTRTRQTPDERREQDRIDARARLVEPGHREPSLDDPGTAYAADFTRYHELGGAKKRRTSEGRYD